MTIKVTYNVTDIYVSETVSATYINVSYETPTGGGGVWGSITGTLSNQTDLQTALDAKFDDPTGTTLQYLRGDGTLATFPSLTGFVPYTGATANVDLGTHTILAQNATISSSGSGDTATITHSSGSGIALNITNGGNGEGLYINKTGGSGNAATIIGTLNATTLVKSGGTSTQYLMADGSVSTLTNPITGTGTAGQVAYFTGATTQAGNNNLFWDSANNRLGIGINVPLYRLHNVGSSAFDNGASGDAITFLNNGFLRMGTTRFRATGNIFDFQDNSYNSKVTFNMAAGISTFNTGGNFHVGGTSDSGQRLQVTGDTLLKGSGNTNATTALLVENSDGTDLLRVRNDGSIRLGNTGTSPSIFPTSGTTYGVDLAGSNLQFFTGTTTQDSSLGRFLFTGSTLSRTTDNVTSGNVALVTTFAPTGGILGNGRFFELLLQSTINQTGTATGITRGLYVNPTLTAAADWRSIEWSNNTGWGLYGAGTAANYLAGSLGINSTALTAYSLRVEKNLTGGTTAFGVYLGGQINSDVTSTAYLFRTRAFTQAASFTLGFLIHYSASNSGLGAGSSITNQYGFIAESGLTQATNNYGFYGGITAATGRWNFYADGTANNFLSGNTQIGTLGAAVLPLYKFSVLHTSTTVYGSTNGRRVAVMANSAGDGNGIEFGYDATDGTGIIAGSTSSLGAGIDFYTYNGTAWGNRMRLTKAGNFLIGSTTDSGEKLQVTGTAKITGASSFGALITAQNGLTSTGGLITQNTGVNSGRMTLLNLRNTAGGYNAALNSSIAVSFTNRVTAGIWSDDFIELKVYDNGSTTSKSGYNFYTHNNQLTTASSVLAMSINGQSVGIGIETPNASAILQADSTTQGFLPPRMTTVEKLAIATPAAGLMVYDTTLNKLCVFTTAWETITSI